MVDFDEFVLDNGLKVYVHEDHSTSLAAVNIAYNVGSKDEKEDKTGFAHLFEHLMFGGSKHIPNYDEPLQKVGGENNAFTSPDLTNYYLTLPANNLETAFWLESDRMLSLSFDPKVLEVQRKVVVEEFKQRYLNQPYGDVWLKLRPLAYTKHPYKWATIGKDIAHIEDATMSDVRSFFEKFYLPNNAVMVVAGNVSVEEVKQLSDKWFGGIPFGNAYVRDLPQEPPQLESRFLELEADVPLNAIYKAYHMPSRLTNDYYIADLVSDVLGRGKSSRLHKQLVKEQKIFNNIHAYITGSVDPGLLVVSGMLNEGIEFGQAEDRINNVIEELLQEKIPEPELTKVKNQAEASLVLSEVELLNRAMNIAFGALIGNPNTINEEAGKIQAVNTDMAHSMANTIFTSNNCSTIHYKAKQ
ncbi:pitrilysin family protein [Fulvivirgaceae bacterium BMA10]|uniref:Pitrilysin family protein n=1 Tax=Splendidivirga corallicola TaxID=3051826 RepID=A0ABT8KRZ7_9BACT|nr:pitrilysin family protein [Fulvivirgaceae bacterium BMA10]